MSSIMNEKHTRLTEDRHIETWERQGAEVSRISVAFWVNGRPYNYKTHILKAITISEGVGFDQK